MSEGNNTDSFIQILDYPSSQYSHYSIGQMADQDAHELRQISEKYQELIDIEHQHKREDQKLDQIQKGHHKQNMKQLTSFQEKQIVIIYNQTKTNQVDSLKLKNLQGNHTDIEQQNKRLHKIIQKQSEQLLTYENFKKKEQEKIHQLYQQQFDRLKYNLDRQRKKYYLVQEKHTYVLEKIKNQKTELMTKLKSFIEELKNEKIEHEKIRQKLESENQVKVDLMLEVNYLRKRNKELQLILERIGKDKKERQQYQWSKVGKIQDKIGFEKSRQLNSKKQVREKKISGRNQRDEPRQTLGKRLTDLYQGSKKEDKNISWIFEK